MRGLAGRRYLVCGAGSGIGEATAIRLHEEGATLVLADRNVQALSRLSQELGDAEYFGYEQDDEASVVALFSAACRNGGFNGIALVAGTHPGRFPLRDIARSEMERIYGINTVGITVALREAERVLAQDQRSSIVLVGSVAGVRPVAHDVIYASSKAAMQAVARAAALELAASGIRVNTVLPGSAVTPLLLAGIAIEDVQRDAERTIPLRRPAAASEVAAAVCFLLSDDAAYITASELFVDGGLAAAGPA